MQDTEAPVGQYPLGEPVISITHEPGDDEDAYFIAGAVSVSLYGSFFICCLWRCYIFLKIFQRSFENKKMIIHLTLTLFAFFEMIYGISHMVDKK
jgi:hypothetical protein